MYYVIGLPGHATTVFIYLLMWSVLFVQSCRPFRCISLKRFIVWWDLETKWQFNWQLCGLPLFCQLYHLLFHPLHFKHWSIKIDMSNFFEICTARHIISMLWKKEFRKALKYLVIMCSGFSHWHFTGNVFALWDLVITWPVSCSAFVFHWCFGIWMVYSLCSTAFIMI